MQVRSWPLRLSVSGAAEQISDVLSDDPRVQAIVLILSWIGIAELTHWLIQHLVEAVRRSDRRRLSS